MSRARSSALKPAARLKTSSIPQGGISPEFQTANSETVIASAAKQSIAPRKGRMDCFVAALVAMTALQIQIRPRVPAARCARGFARNVRPSINRGRRECRVPNAPIASRAKLNKAHERSHHRYTGNNPAFPAQWFYGLYRALPGDEFLLSPSLAD